MIRFILRTYYSKFTGHYRPYVAQHIKSSFTSCMSSRHSPYQALPCKILHLGAILANNNYFDEHHCHFCHCSSHFVAVSVILSQLKSCDKKSANFVAAKRLCRCNPATKSLWNGILSLERNLSLKSHFVAEMAICRSDKRFMKHPPGV